MLKLEPSRRALLAGAALASVATIPAATASPNAADAVLWRERVATYEAALAEANRRAAAFDAFSRANRGEPGFKAQFEAHGRAVDQVWNVKAAAWDALIECPAPDLAALQYKLALWTDDFDEQCAVTSDSELGRVQWAILKADMMRVGGDHTSAAAFMAEAAAIRSNTALLRAVSETGGRLAHHPERGQHGEFVLLWAPTPPSSVDAVALAARRAKLEPQFLTIRHQLKLCDMRRMDDAAYKAWGGSNPYADDD